MHERSPLVQRSEASGLVKGVVCGRLPSLLVLFFPLPFFFFKSSFCPYALLDSSIISGLPLLALVFVQKGEKPRREEKEEMPAIHRSITKGERGLSYEGGQLTSRLPMSHEAQVGVPKDADAIGESNSQPHWNKVEIHKLGREPHLRRCPTTQSMPQERQAAHKGRAEPHLPVGQNDARELREQVRSHVFGPPLKGPQH